ncbi:hypothetical protein STAQ_27660 [Allostella sp. ATCC 35155]|nr:hypothetical protein STAQ_27660 [Stella sp. ATCC 35155]
MSVNGTLGSKLLISTTPVAESVDSEAGYSALGWTEVGLIDNFGEFGRQFDLVTFQPVKDGRTRKFKGGFNDGSTQFTMGQDLTDAGQAAMKAAADAATQDNYGFRIELNDPPSLSGGPTTFFFRGLAMSFRTQMGAANSVVKATAMVEVNSDIVQTLPAAIYDRFLTGGSLAAYELFNGSDAQAADPEISADTLVMVTGDAGTGYAADGTQIIADAGFVPSAGAIVVEARLKASAVTEIALFVGLTDQKAALEAPIESAASADTLTSNATDAVGWMFDTDMATDNLWLVGVNNDVDETAQNAGVALAGDTYVTLRVEVEADGDARFYRNGVQVGTAMATALATGATLYPTIVAAARDTASRTITVDYLYARQD